MKKKNEAIWKLVNEGYTYNQARYVLRRQKQGLKSYDETKYKDFSKEELINLGVTNVSEDGLHIFIGDTELPQVKLGLYKAVKINHKHYCVHRIVYVWFNNYQPANMVVDHIDNDKYNNNVSNLQLLTRGENVNKSKGTYQVRNQYTKNMTEEEIIALKEKKKAIKEAKEEWHQEILRKNALKENHSKEVQERANKIRDLNYAVDISRFAYKISKSDEDKAVWKECVKAKNDYIANNPKEHKTHCII